MDYYKSYFVYKNRVDQLKRELNVARRMMIEAEQMINERREFITWVEDDLPY